MSAPPFSIGSDLWPGVSKLIEEMGELAQVCGKLLATGGEAAHWDGSDLRERFSEEAGDVLAALYFVLWRALPVEDADAAIARMHVKTETFNRWHREQVT